MLKGVKGKRLFAMALIFNFLFSSVVFFADSSNVHAFTAKCGNSHGGFS